MSYINLIRIFDSFYGFDDKTEVLKDTLQFIKHCYSINYYKVSSNIDEIVLTIHIIVSNPKSIGLAVEVSNGVEQKMYGFINRTKIDSSDIPFSLFKLVFNKVPAKIEAIKENFPYSIVLE